MDKIIVYMSSASGSREIKYQQEAIFRYLESMNITYYCKDVTVDPSLKEEMREKVGNPKALPPQVFRGGRYCGDYQAFFEAIEYGRERSFFGE